MVDKSFRAISIKLACGIAACFLTACASVNTTSPGVVGVARSQYLSVSGDRYEQSIADSYADVLREAGANHKLNQDDVLVQRVSAIAQRMIPHTEIFRADAPGWDWEINIITSPQINALCFGKGKIIVFSGLIENLRLTDDEIAILLGHEIAHGLREHNREQASQRSRSKLLTSLLGVLVGEDEELDQLAALFYLLPNSREQETEADRMGLELAARAGYDPGAAIAVWRKFQHVTGPGQAMQFWSTHPPHESRLRDVQAYSEKLAAAYSLKQQKN